CPLVYVFPSSTPTASSILSPSTTLFRSAARRHHPRGGPHRGGDRGPGGAVVRGRLRRDPRRGTPRRPRPDRVRARRRLAGAGRRDRKSTRLNSSHVKISYAVFCLKKKKT